MSTAAVNTSNVHLGPWINWSHGAVRGSTITLTPHHGAILTAFIALFVSYAGSRFWSILCFVLHLLLSNKSPQDAIYHQRQGLLRNYSSPLDAFFDFCSMIWVWRGIKGVSKISRILPFLLIGLILSTTFTAAGLLSANISSAMGNEVLLYGPDCGLFIQNTTVPEIDLENSMWPYVAEFNQMALQRAAQCSTKGVTQDTCPTYIQTNLTLMDDENASCPFDDRICQSKTGNLFLDTG